jgi:hypothetical protein
MVARLRPAGMRPQAPALRYRRRLVLSGELHAGNFVRTMGIGMTSGYPMLGFAMTIAATLNEVRPIRRLGVTRRQLLKEFDRPALKLLPIEPYGLPNGACAGLG